jgi:hypothetical protein
VIRIPNRPSTTRTRQHPHRPQHQQHRQTPRPAQSSEILTVADTAHAAENYNQRLQKHW